MTNNSDYPLPELKTLLDMVRWSVSQFDQADIFYGHGTDNAWDEAVTLVLHSLHLPQHFSQNQALFQARLTRDEVREIAHLVSQRTRLRKPLAYLINQAWFCGLPFYVDERVLVPRSPFSELINDGFERWLSKPPTHILDLCTGSGCIAVALAHVFPHAQVDAVDLYDDALEVASYNVSLHELDDRVYPIKSDLMSALDGQKYDLIVCNPPYVDDDGIATMPEEFSHEPIHGLAAGSDGLELIERLLKQALLHLNEHGWLFVEVGDSQKHMATRFADMQPEWIDFEKGGSGVFAMSHSALADYWTRKTVG